MKETFLDSIGKNYMEALADLRRVRWLILAAAIIFIAGIAIGARHPSWSEGSLSALKQFARQLSRENLFALVLAIFLRNSLVASVCVVSGPLLGVLPLLISVLNGLILGSALSYVDEAHRVTALLLLLPHGIFELPALFTACGIGLWQGITVFQKNATPLRERRSRSLRILFIVVIPLLLIAAIIEGTNIYTLRG